jgi:uncharacterized protein (TIGR04255 family)
MPSNNPSFKSPPVVETVLCAQWEAVPLLTNAHLGVFWNELGSDWLNVLDAPPLPLEREYFGSQRIWERLGNFRFQMTTTPSLRLQIKNSMGDRMIQVQNGVFCYNWLGNSGVEYARYEIIRAEFDKAFARWTDFINRRNLGEIEVVQWEVTYVNHLPQGSVWTSPANWNDAFVSPIVLPSQVPAGIIESFSGKWDYIIAPERGRLHVEVHHARANPDTAQEILALQLTARGIVDRSKGWDLSSGLDLGHNCVVQSFTALTSDRAHKTWEELP